jgi:cyclase
MKIADGVFAVLDMWHPYGVNAGIVTTGRSTLFVDSSMTIGSARTIVGYAAAAAPEAEPRYLVLTEHHSDHVFGMSVMRELGCRVLGPAGINEFLATQGPTYREAMIERWLSARTREDAERIFEGVQLYQVDEEVHGDRSLMLDDLELLLLSTPGHLLDALSVFIPRHRVLFSGDLIYSGFPPTTRFGDLELWRQWIASLRKVEALHPEVIVPGHGRPCGPEEIARHVTFLEESIARAGAKSTSPASGAAGQSAGRHRNAGR